jgi:hypothetical protein
MKMMRTCKALLYGTTTPSLKIRLHPMTPCLRKRAIMARLLEKMKKILTLSAESQSQRGVNRSDATPEAVEKLKEFLKGKLQERQHALSHTPSGSPGHVNPLRSPREDPEDVVTQVI